VKTKLIKEILLFTFLQSKPNLKHV